MGRFGIGSRAERTEDNRFLTGKGEFLDDITFEGAYCTVFVRSPVAHANLVKIDIADAKVDNKPASVFGL